MSRPATTDCIACLLAGPELLEAEHLAGELADAAGADRGGVAGAGCRPGSAWGKQAAPARTSPASVIDKRCRRSPGRSPPRPFAEPVTAAMVQAVPDVGALGRRPSGVPATRVDRRPAPGGPHAREELGDALLDRRLAAAQHGQQVDVVRRGRLRGGAAPARSAAARRSGARSRAGTTGGTTGSRPTGRRPLGGRQRPGPPAAAAT